MKKYEALEKIILNDDYDKILMRQAEEYNKPAWEKLHHVKADKL